VAPKIPQKFFEFLGHGKIGNFSGCEALLRKHQKTLGFLKA